MNITDIVSKSGKPKIYEKGTAFMWTDQHISKQLLDIHLNPDIDLASRKKSSIDKTANWILESQMGKGKLSILDLGCGPGLYTEIFAEKGHQVTGMDISRNSIEYARKSAKKRNLDITYINQSYLEADLGSDRYDLVVLIFTDLGVLTPWERGTLLAKIFRVLKKGGTFIFDVLKDKEIENKTSPKSWEVCEKGFWKETPYLALSESFIYPEEKVILFQHIIADTEGDIDIYRFWTHCFSQNQVRKMLEAHNFTDIKSREDILPEGDMWNGDNVIFALASIRSDE